MKNAREDARDVIYLWMLSHSHLRVFAFMRFSALASSGEYLQCFTFLSSREPSAISGNITVAGTTIFGTQRDLYQLIYLCD